LANTCNDLLKYCLRGEQWPDDLLDKALAVDDGRAFLSVVVERLGDLFEPRLCATYDRLFTEVILRTAPELAPRIRKTTEAPSPPGSASRVYVLSRVTLGADVAVTSVLMDAAKRRFPSAEIVFVGPQKSHELFAADPRVKHLPAPYARSGALRDRLRASANLWLKGGIVIDPDSRLSQLGLISVCDEHNYFFFPSRAYGIDGNDSLSKLAARWAHQVLGVEGAKPYIAPVASAQPPADVTVSLGVGENAAKRLDDERERELLRALAKTAASILVDKGGSPEEHERVERAVLPGMRTHDGAFAPFAAQIAKSKLFVGYDSAGGHVASACGVPLISIAKGFISERMAARWRPDGVVLTESEVSQIPALVRQILNT
jgi:Glycosyltransferase family 9 (heptosyltransferase)